MKSHVGCYRGVNYARMKICDVLAVESQMLCYFIRDKQGAFTGDHFPTLSELHDHIDFSCGIKGEPTDGLCPGDAYDFDQHRSPYHPM